jgi:MoaA/NifB/PqqE/SkfB family radical SAM enzyme
MAPRNLQAVNAPALTRRGEIRLGYRCNARCDFCYYKERLDTPKDEEPQLDTLRNHLYQLRRHGASEVELTGGEPTIRTDLLDLVSEARELGFRNISMITNGLRLANTGYATRLIGAGLNDCLISIHGHTPELHDRHTSIPGSFAKTLQAASNVLENGARLRVSITVTGLNYPYLTEIVGAMLDLGAACIHLPVFSPVSDAADASADVMYVSYTDAATAIKEAIDAHRSRLPPVSVKYIPVCFLEGYENFVMNLYQQSFDPDDWNYYWSNKLRRAKSGITRVLFDLLVTAVGYTTRLGVQRAHPRPGQRQIFGLIRIVELLRKKRVSACKDCRYDAVCDHVWKGYIDRFGASEIRPVVGSRITDPVWAYDMARYRSSSDRVAEPMTRSPVTVSDGAV